MCEPSAEGGKRCAAHTRPPYNAVIEQLRGTNKFERQSVRGGSTGEMTNLQVLRDHASTPAGKKEIQAVIAEFQTGGDQTTVFWLRNGLKQGDQKAEADAAIRKEIRAATTKVKRAASLSSSSLKASRGVTFETSLAGVYPDIAEQWATDKNGGITPDQVTPYVNARVWWRCENGHEWEARCNNRTNRARSGVRPWCPECHGTRQKSLENMQEKLAKFMQAVDDDPDAWESLSPAMRHAILARTGMLSGSQESFQNATALSMIHGDLSLRDIVKAKDVADIANSINEDLDSDEGDADKVLNFDEGIEETGMYPQEADLGTRIDRIMASAGTAGLVPDDDQLVGQIVRENIETLWNESYNNPQDVEEILARVKQGAERNEYRAMVAAQFEEELRRVQNTPLPDGFVSTRTNLDGSTYEIEPHLSQRRFALLVEEKRRFANWSGTGAGKTLSATLASRQIGAEETIVFCPAGSVMRQWKAEFEQGFPDDTEVRMGLPEPGEDLDATRDGRKRVWVVNWDKLSANSKEAEERLAPLASRLDMAVLDELQRVKQTDESSQSKRRGVLQNFLDKAGESNENLAVVGQSATPVVTNLEEARSMLRLVNGEEPRGFGTAPTIKNAAIAYQHLSQAGVRWRPGYRPALALAEIKVDITSKLPEIMARVDRLAEGKPNAHSRPALMERALLPEKLPSIVSEVRSADGPTVVYTEYTTGMVDPIVDRLRSEGFTAARYTGEENAQERADLLRRFQSGEVKVIVGSKPIATGVDGLQRVCSDMVVVSGPWTASDEDQLVGRVYRQGQTRDVRIKHIITEAEVEGTKWSFDRNRLNRRKFRRGLSDAAVDGVVPDGQLSSSADATATAVEGLRRMAAAWSDRA